LFVKDLKSRAAVEEIELEIVSVGESRSFASGRGEGKVANAAAKDSKGDEVSVTLWNEQIDQVKEGSKIKIEKGWATEYQGNLQISTGKFGTLTVLD